MSFTIIILFALHALGGVFWAGTTFTVARFGALGGAQMFRAQMIAAVVTFTTGLILWGMLHKGFGSFEMVLSVGVLTALGAAGVQGALNAQPEKANRIAAVLLAVTVVTMVTGRYFVF